MKFLSVKICCFCCLVFAYFSFCYLVCTCFVFFVLQKFLLKKIELVLMASFTILVMCTPLNPSIKIYFSPIFFFFCMHLFWFMRIPYNHLQKIFSYLWSSARIFLNPSYLWESLYIHDHLWESFRTYFCFLQSLWK